MPPGIPSPAHGVTSADSNEEPETAPGASPDTAFPDEAVEVIHVLGERGKAAKLETLSVTSFDQASLDELGIQDIDSLQQFVPSLHIGQVGTSAVITLRGIGFDNLTILGEPGVLFQIDGVPLSRPSSANAAFYDVENVEILRGPQGTQGGRNSTAGRIAISSARPVPDLEVFGDTQIGTASQIIQRAVLNVPIWDEYLMSRMSFIYQNRDGYQRNILPIYSDSKYWADDADEFAFRGQLLSQITDSFQVRGFANYSHQKGVGPAYKTIGPLFRQALYCPDNGRRWGRPFCPVSTLNGLPTVVNPGDPRETTANVVGQLNDRQYGFTGHLNYDFPEIDEIGGISLGTIMSYQFTENRNGDGKNFFCFANPAEPCAVVNYGIDLDATNSYISFVDTEQRADQNSFEVWLESRDADVFSWKVGMFHLKETIYGDSLVGVVQSPQTLADSFASAESRQRVVTDTKAGYGEIEYWLLDNLQLKTGIRYTRGSKSISRQIKNNEGSKELRATTWSGWTPMALMRWDVTDDNSLAESWTSVLQ